MKLKLPTSPKKLRQTWLKTRIYQIRLKRWWFRNDRRYGFWWRLGNGAAAVLILVSVVLPVIQQLSNSDRYKLSADTVKLVGKTDETLAQQLSYDGQTSTYQFNKAAIKDDSANPLAALKAQVGTAHGKGKDKSLYALDVPTDFSKGVTYHDINSQLSFSLVPQFTATQGKSVDGHLVYPLAGGNQAIYTLKNNGLKEDIVVPKASTDSMSFSYSFNLPKTLQAKVIPNSDGAIGIYSGNPTLFGNISYGSDADRASVEKARENADKTYLVFGLPSPVIKDIAGNKVGSARFQLNGNNLSVIATGLTAQKSPVTIDPSVVVTSTSDFQQGNVEDNIDFGTSGQITRGGLTGGTLNGGWTTSATTLPQTLEKQGTIAYNGYIYLVGGQNRGVANYANVYYATLNPSTGDIGSWSSTTSLPYSYTSAPTVIVNGYMYVVGGLSTQVVVNHATSAVYYIAVNSNGTLGSTWLTTTSLPTPISDEGITSYNGYVYVLGGTPTTGGACGGNADCQSTVYYAPANGDGTLGSWTATTSFTNARALAKSFAYNGYLYIVGGGNSTYLNDVQYAKINTDGSVGTWIATSSFSTGRYAMAGYISNGYMYIGGGQAGSVRSDVQYAQIYANGSIGTWRTSTSLTTARLYPGSAIYNGYVYALGGYTGTTDVNSIEYAKIDPAGDTNPYTQNSNVFTTGRKGHQTIISNGYMYVMGGDGGSTPVNTMYMATLAADGSVGSFTSAGTLPNSNTFFAAVAYNGYMYVIGGCTSAWTSCTTATNDLATVYQSALSVSNGTFFGGWTAQTSITTARYGLSAVAYNGTMYVMGGLNGSTFLNDMQYQPFGASGVLTGTWTTSSKTISTARAYFGTVLYGGVIYIAGGCTAGATTCTTTQNDVQYAQLTTASGVGGDLSASFTATGNSSFSSTRGMLGLTVMNGYLYIMGGRDNTTYYGDTQYAPINSNGTVGTWATDAGVTMASNRYGMGVAASNGFIYYTGGTNGISHYTQVFYATVNNGGGGGATASTWATNSTDISGAYANGIAYGQVFAYQNYLYAVGGYDGTARYATVWSAPFNTDGSIGTWSQQTSMNTAKNNFVLEIYNGYVYVYTGLITSVTESNTYEYAKLQTGGGLGTWTTDATMSTSSGSVPVRQTASGAVYNGYLYVLGGSTSGAYDADVYYAPLNANGSVGTWVSANAFTSGRNNAGSFAYDGYIYEVAGSNGGGYLMDVQMAALDAGTGAVGTWSYTTPVVRPRAYFNLTAANGFVYVYGGNNAGGALTMIEEAPILSNGQLGTWEKSAGSAFTTARSNGAGVINNGYVYTVGGYSSSGPTYYKDIQYSPLNAQPRVGHYSKLVDLGSSVNVTSITYNGKLPTGAAAVTYRAASASSPTLGTSGLANSVSGTAGCFGNLTATRYVWLFITLDDSNGLGSGGYFADINGAASANANLTDVTVNYNIVHPPPNIRLRAGQTLQTGNLSALDTCYP